MIKSAIEIDIIIQKLKNGYLDEGLKKLEKIIITNSNKNLIYKLFASIYFKKKLGEFSPIL